VAKKELSIRDEELIQEKESSQNFVRKKAQALDQLSQYEREILRP